jgi:hypothetical protein
LIICEPVFCYTMCQNYRNGSGMCHSFFMCIVWESLCLHVQVLKSWWAEIITKMTCWPTVWPLNMTYGFMLAILLVAM